MSQSYFLILKKYNLLSSSIDKLILFNNIELAYEFALNLNISSKDKENTIDQVLDTHIVWSTITNEFPIYICQIIPIDNDIMWNIYQNINDTNKIIPCIYKELFINNLIN